MLIGKSISTIVSRYLFALGLNARGLGSKQKLVAAASSVSGEAVSSESESGEAAAAVRLAEAAQDEFNRVREILSSVKIENWRDVFKKVSPHISAVDKEISKQFDTDVTALEEFIAARVRGDLPRDMLTRLNAISVSVRQSMAKVVDVKERDAQNLQKIVNLQKLLASS